MATGSVEIPGGPVPQVVQESLRPLQRYRVNAVASLGRHSVTVGPPTRTLRCPLHRCGTLVGRRPGFRSTFPPPDARPRGTGQNRQGRRVTADAVDRPFVQVTSDYRDQVGMRRDPRGDGGATCKIVGDAFTGSNPVPATNTNAVSGSLGSAGCQQAGPGPRRSGAAHPRAGQPPLPRRRRGAGTRHSPPGHRRVARRGRHRPGHRQAAGGPAARAGSAAAGRRPRPWPTGRGRSARGPRW